MEILFNGQYRTLYGIKHGEEMLEEHLKLKPKKEDKTYKSWKLEHGLIMNKINRLVGYKKHPVKK